MSDEAFRAEARAWLAENFDPALVGQDFTKELYEREVILTDVQKEWTRRVGAKGWGVPTWPREYGGGGLSRAEAEILFEEMDRIDAWNPISGMGVMMLGPALLEFGTEEQKKRHIPHIATAEIRWCQGYSEPGAGSDLASLQCRAEDKGDHYLVNGSKIWTSGAQWSDWCFALVRTDTSDKYRGISFLLIDMRSPGVEVKPIRLISGTSPFCETFFTDVKVPKENLVGELTQGWTIGKRVLQYERSSIGSGNAKGGGKEESLSDIARRYLPQDADGNIADSDLRMRITAYEMDAHAFALTARRVAEESEGGGVSTTGSILKNLGARLTQTRYELLVEIMGMAGLGWADAALSDEESFVTREWLRTKAISIYGGSHEVQNNIIAKNILGLRDHQ